MSSPLEKIFCFSETANHPITPAIPSHYRGAFRDRHLTFGRAAVDVDGAKDESTRRGRRSRVVLTPRRWRQVRGGNSANDGVNKPITGEITYKP
jgi:hypothetical protein